MFSARRLKPAPAANSNGLASIPTMMWMMLLCVMMLANLLVQGNLVSSLKMSKQISSVVGMMVDM